MKKYSDTLHFKIISIICIIISFCFVTPGYASAQDLSYTISSLLNPVILDKADIFSDYEEVTISNRFSALRDTNGFQYILLTATDTVEYTRGREVEEIYTTHHDELYGTGTIIFLISTDSDNPICEVQAYSQANKIFTHEVCSYISSTISDYMQEGAYYEGISKFFELHDDACRGILDINSDSASDESSLLSFTKQNKILVFFLLPASMLVTDIIISIILLKNTQQKDKKNNDDSFIIGSCTYKFKLTKNIVTYIRTRT